MSYLSLIYKQIENNKKDTTNNSEQKALIFIAHFNFRFDLNVFGKISTIEKVF